MYFFLGFPLYPRAPIVHFDRILLNVELYDNDFLSFYCISKCSLLSCDVWKRQSRVLSTPVIGHYQLWIF